MRKYISMWREARAGEGGEIVNPCHTKKRFNMLIHFDRIK